MLLGLFLIPKAHWMLSFGIMEQGCLINCLSVNEIHKIMKEGLILWNKPTSPANSTQTESKKSFEKNVTSQDNNII